VEGSVEIAIELSDNNYDCSNIPKESLRMYNKIASAGISRDEVGVEVELRWT
jgi:hypothetical protein